MMETNRMIAPILPPKGGTTNGLFAGYDCEACTNVFRSKPEGYGLLGFSTLKTGSHPPAKVFFHWKILRA